MFHEMRYVLAVYRHQSFSRAAAALFISQPSLSQMIRKAEERLGAPIFDRSTTPISLTDVGRAYVHAATQVLDLEENLRQYVSDTENCLTGTLSLGGTTLQTSYVFPPLISAFSALFPNVGIDVQEMHTSALKKALRDGDIDLVADNSLFDPAVFESRPYLTDRVLLAVPGRLPIAEATKRYQLPPSVISDADALEKAECVPLALFSQEDFLLLKEGNDTRDRADELCRLAGFKPKIRLLLDQQIAAYNLAAYGMGITFVSDTLVCHAPPDERLCFYRLPGEATKREIRFFYKRTHFVTRPMREFLRLLGNES